MTNFVFDLDDTLYKKGDVSYNKYLNLELKKLKLKGKLLIFSNNSRSNGVKLLKKLKMITIFNKNTFYSSDVHLHKPSIMAYRSFIDKFNLKRNTVFFENSLHNLRTAKQFNWTTVLINSTIIKKPAYVDYLFTSIEDGVNFFVKYKSSLK